MRCLNPATIAKPASAYSHGVAFGAGETIVVSGQIGFRPDGSLPDDFDGQCRQAFENIAAILAEGGMGLEHVVRIGGFLKRRSDTAAFRRLRDAFVSHRPASTVVIAELIGEDWLIEIEVLAHRPA